MDGMAKHARLTTGQQWLAAGYVIFGITLTPIAFIVMLLTVQALLAPSLHFWAWTVPVGTEAGFIGLFCADLLLEWKHRPLRVLRAAPYLFAVISLALNVYAAHGAIPAMLGHAVLPLVFFGYILVAEAVVRRLAVTEEERAAEVAMADALAHARDLVRDRLGVFWRLRCPSLLSRQIRSGRATAAVREAARGGSQAELETTVGRWIAQGLAVSAKAEVTAQEARREITREAPVSVPESTPEPSPRARPQARLAARSGPALKLAAARSRNMTPGELEPHVSAMLEEYGTVSQARVKRDLHVSTEKAAEALRLAKRNRTVVQISAR
jgi:hypothetical protein